MIKFLVVTIFTLLVGQSATVAAEFKSIKLSGRSVHRLRSFVSYDLSMGGRSFYDQSKPSGDYLMNFALQSPGNTFNWTLRVRDQKTAERTIRFYRTWAEDSQSRMCYSDCYACQFYKKVFTILQDQSGRTLAVSLDKDYNAPYQAFSCAGYRLD